MVVTRAEEVAGAVAVHGALLVDPEMETEGLVETAQGEKEMYWAIDLPRSVQSVEPCWESARPKRRVPCVSFNSATEIVTSPIIVRHKEQGTDNPKLVPAAER